MMSDKYDSFAHEICNTPRNNKLAVVTFAHDSTGWWDYFYSYYSTLSGPKGIYVFTENSSNFTKYSLGGCICAENLTYDDRKRAIMMSNFSNTLKMYYEWVCICDVDEIIMPHPSLGLNLIDYLERTCLNIIFSRGLNVLHYEDDPDFDMSKGILGQRNYFVPSTLFYKPSLSRRYNINYSPGYHTCSCFPELTTPKNSLLLFHLKNADLNTSKELSKMFKKANYEDSNIKKISISSFMNSKYKLNTDDAVALESLQLLEFEKKFLMNTHIRHDGVCCIFHDKANFTIDINKERTCDIDKYEYITIPFECFWKQEADRLCIKQNTSEILKFCNTKKESIDYIFKQLIELKQNKTIDALYSSANELFLQSPIPVFCYILSCVSSSKTNSILEALQNSTNLKLTNFCITALHLALSYLFDKGCINDVIEISNKFLSKNEPTYWIYPLLARAYTKINQYERAAFFLKKNNTLNIFLETKKNFIKPPTIDNQLIDALKNAKQTATKEKNQDITLISPLENQQSIYNSNHINILKNGDNAVYSKDFYDKQQEQSYISAKNVLSNLFKLLPNMPKNAVDVGCGVGPWSRRLIELGITDILAIDGDYVPKSMLLIPTSNFVSLNLESRIFKTINKRFDLALCLEVAEHLPEERSKTFIEDLTLLSDTILFSAAIPNQRGSNHINEQWQSYWVNLFSLFGFFPHFTIRDMCWEVKDIAVWYRQNIILFDKHHEIITQPIDIVHPRLFLSRSLSDKSHIKS